MAREKQAAALVILLAFVLGPKACEGATSVCFNGWLRLPILNPLLCPRGSRQNRPPRQWGWVPRPSGAGLAYGYYNNWWSPSSYCPSAEAIVRNAVRQAVAANPGVGAGLIRLLFHDCFVRGCDASVLLTRTNSGNADTERVGPPNMNSLRGFEVIDAAKARLERVCPRKVSCADVVAFAARDASYFLSGGRVNVRMPGGRLDGRESFANETDQLPGPFSNVTDLQASFAAKGLSSDEMVTLSGAHTVGRARCLFFSSRLGEMYPALAARLRAQCGGNGGATVNEDDVTPDVLDAQYYRNVVDRKALFVSDATLVNSTDTLSQVTQNANVVGAWERKFERAMESMGKVEVKTRRGRDAEIRNVCWSVNRGWW